MHRIHQRLELFFLGVVVQELQTIFWGGGFVKRIVGHHFSLGYLVV